MANKKKSVSNKPKPSPKKAASKKSAREADEILTDIELPEPDDLLVDGTEVEEEIVAKPKTKKGKKASLPVVRDESGELTGGADTLVTYLNEIRKYPLLTPQEEHELAVKYKQTGDRAAAEKMVTSNLRFVVKVAAEYSKFGIRMIDLIQEGNVGLMQAVRQFNPDAGVRLITYAVWWIRGYIQEYLMKHYSMVKIGTTQAQKKLFYQLQKQKAALEAAGFESDVKLLASSLGVTEQEVTDMQSRMSNRDLSLDAPVDESGRATFVESQSDINAEGADEQLGDEEEKIIFRREIKKIIPTLNEKEKFLLEHRVLGDPPLTLQEVGDKYGITRERARQLEERLLGKIKTHMVKVFPDYEINLAKDE